MHRPGWRAGTTAPHPTSDRSPPARARPDDDGLEGPCVVPRPDPEAADRPPPPLLPQPPPRTYRQFVTQGRPSAPNRRLRPHCVAPWTPSPASFRPGNRPGRQAGPTARGRSANPADPDGPPSPVVPPHERGASNEENTIIKAGLRGYCRHPADRRGCTCPDDASGRGTSELHRERLVPGDHVLDARRRRDRERAVLDEHVEQHDRPCRLQRGRRLQREPELHQWQRSQHAIRPGHPGLVHLLDEHGHQLDRPGEPDRHGRELDVHHRSGEHPDRHHRRRHQPLLGELRGQHHRAFQPRRDRHQRQLHRHVVRSVRRGRHRLEHPLDA